MYKTSIISIILIFTSISLASAQKSGHVEFEGRLMPYIVEGNDTIFLAPLKPAHVYQKLPRKKGREWRKYYKLVYNFAKVYPYAVVAKGIVLEADSTIKTQKLKYIKKDRYISAIIKDLFNTFEKPLRNLTISQGALLMKLIDRECGISSYEIIAEFKNSYAAAFWQGVAKMFGSDLKKPYDPNGDDAATEELVEQWWADRFEQTYYEIYWELPPIVEIPYKYLKNARLPQGELERQARLRAAKKQQK